MSPHGTVCRYTVHKCRCERCRCANRIYQAKYLMGRRSRKFVPAGQTRQHLRFLLTHGWSLRTLSKHLGMSYSAVQAIAAGKRDRVDLRSAERILAAHTLTAPYRGKRTPGGRTHEWNKLPNISSSSIPTGGTDRAA